MKFLFVVFISIAFTTEGFCQSSNDAKVDKFARFPGGAEKFYEYVKTNLQYPPDALQDSITGDVFVQFKLDNKGGIVKESAKVVKSLSPSCDNEALRLIKTAPPWTPAESKGMGVETVITFPVTFILD